MPTSQDSGPKRVLVRNWGPVESQIVDGKRCTVLHRFSPGSYQYKWVDDDTGALVQELKVPHRTHKVTQGVHPCLPFFNYKGRKIALAKFVRCVPHFAKAMTLDREFKLNKTTSLLYDSARFEENTLEVTIATLVRHY